MISKELYNLAIEADKVAKNNGGCGTCFCGLVKENIESSSNLKKSFLNWKIANSVYTICSSVLFYLEDLGIIKILGKNPDKSTGIDCYNLEIKPIHNFKYNKISKKKNFMKHF